MKNWKPILAAVLLIALVLFVVLDWSRFLADFWPLDSSRVGPNLVAAVVQGALVLAAVALLYPPVRHWIEEHFDTMHKKLDHVILHHPDIPNEVPGLPAHRQPKNPQDTSSSA